jgi:hypothetical protein
MMVSQNGELALSDRGFRFLNAPAKKRHAVLVNTDLKQF